MTKAKHRQIGTLATKKAKVSNDADLENDDDWVIVKKQRVTIIVPPLALPSVLKPHHVSTKRRKTTHLHKHKRNPTTLKEKRTSPTSRALPKVHRFIGESVDHRPSLNFVHDHHGSRGHGSLKTSGVSGLQRPVRVPAAPRTTCHRRPTVFHRPICLNVSALQNRMMRAANLERKLVKAGGLNRWLMSLDLGLFVKMFHSRNVDKFQLLSLTMEKLKDMGVNAVGPRRKLIHAIDCINHPYCFSTS